MADHDLLISIVADYAPYDRFAAFNEGFADYQHGLHHNPYDRLPNKSFQAQAWDQGQEAAMRYARALGKGEA